MDEQINETLQCVYVYRRLQYTYLIVRKSCQHGEGRSEVAFLGAFNNMIERVAYCSFPNGSMQKDAIPSCSSMECVSCAASNSPGSSSGTESAQYHTQTQQMKLSPHCTLSTKLDVEREVSR